MSNVKMTISYDRLVALIEDANALDTSKDLVIMSKADITDLRAALSELKARRSEAALPLTRNAPPLKI